MPRLNPRTLKETPLVIKGCHACRFCLSTHFQIRTPRTGPAEHPVRLICLSCRRGFYI